MNQSRDSLTAVDESFLRRSEDAVGLTEVFGAIRRRKGLITGTVLLFMALAGIIVFQLTPRYTAHSSILVEGDEADIARLEPGVVGLPPDLVTVASEVEVLSSRGLAERVIDRLQLAHSPEFNAALRSQSSLANAFDLFKSYLPADWRAVLVGQLDKQGSSEADFPGGQRARIIDAFLDRLEISQLEESRVIDVAFTSQSAKLAASVANTLPKIYVHEQREVKLKAAQQATAWLEERVAALKKKVKAADTAVEEFRRRSELIKADGATLSSQQLAELSTQLSLARAARAETEARFREIQKLIDSSGSVASSQEVMTSPLIQSLREQEVELERKLGEMSSVFGKLHPEMIKLRSEIHDLRAKIEAEAERIVDRFRYETESAKAREQSLQRSVAKLKEQVARSNEQAIQLRALELDALASRRLLETFLSRLEQTSLQDTIDVQQANARIISRADVPHGPSFPMTAPILALTFAGSTFMGLVLVFVIEQLDHGFRSGEQIERDTGVPVLALIPEHSGFLGRPKAPESYILTHSLSSLGEAIRTLHTSLLFLKPDRPLKTILVTSALPKEGKTAIVVCLARMRALAGQKVVVVDADCRKPRVHRVFGIISEPGLVELLTGKADLKEVIRKDKASGADVITAGGSESNPPDILGSEQMDRFLDTLARTYDLVILDSPPCMAVSDARILSKKVDGTVFVVRWVDTRRAIVRQGFKQVATSGGNLVGSVLSRVDVKEHARYDYGDSGSYSGSLKKYYANR